MKNLILLFSVLMMSACAIAVAPTPSLTATSTVTNTATIPPTATPSPSLTPSPTAVPNGPCDNPLMPMAVGNHWIYRVATARGERVYNLKVLEIRDIGNLVAVVEFGNEAESVQESVICLDGAIENFPLFVMDMLFADVLNKFMNTYHDKGLYSPSHASFVENGWVLYWQAFYLTEDSAGIADPLGGPSLILVQSSPIDLSFEMDGTREVVTVPAGEFPQALKVSHTFTVSATLGANGGHLTLETTQWYEPYVGLVRAQVDTASYTMGGQKAGIPLQSVLELVEFSPGK
ncbi:MAG TPA: hypothetical protein VIS72_13310 [Anaerolineales bacterium]